MPTQNWWARRTSYSNNRTPVEIATSRVRYYLTIYPQLEGAAHYGSALWGGDDDAPKLFVASAEDYPSGPAWEENACIKADLDSSLRQCTRRQQEAVRARFLTAGSSYRDAAASLPGKPDVYRLCTRAIATMGKLLAGNNNKTGSQIDGISRRAYKASPRYGHDSQASTRN